MKSHNYVVGPAILILLVLAVSCAGKFRQAMVAGRPGLEDHERFPVRLLEPDTSIVFSFHDPSHPLPGIDLDASMLKAGVDTEPGTGCSHRKLGVNH